VGVEVINEQFLGTVALSLMTAFALFAVWWMNARAESVLERWCAHTGFDLIERRYCLISSGPYALAALTGQWVYRVTIRNRAGRVRQGYVCVGNAVLGVLAEEVAVRWDA
jgi:hypothetical protein